MVTEAKLKARRQDSESQEGSRFRKKIEVGSE